VIAADRSASSSADRSDASHRGSGSEVDRPRPGAEDFDVAAGGSGATGSSDATVGSFDAAGSSDVAAGGSGATAGSDVAASGSDLSADVVVVGAGPAGSAAAYHMAVAGLDVIVLERGELGRDKVCGDGLTPSAVTELALMGVDTTGWRRNKGLRVVGGGHILHIPWPEQASLPSYGLARRRTELDRDLAERAAAARADWDARFEAWRAAEPDRAALLERLRDGRLPEGLDEALPSWEAGQSLATRAASGRTLSALADVVPELWGGSADLAGSNNTTMAGAPSFLPASLAHKEGDGPYGRTLHFGVREHAMGGILNGIALDGLTRPYGGTFMVFSDYMRPPVRLAALMGIDPVFVWTHDSIGVGEDGPTHQPIEHLASLRAIPGLDVVRPGDANETAAAWRVILQRRHHPAGLVLSRQNLPVLADARTAAAGVPRGAYVLGEAADADGGPVAPEAVIIATGSEVGVAAAARDILQASGTPTRVVSAPCLEWFAEQDEDYRARVLPEGAVTVSVEAGIAMGWREIVGARGEIVSIDHFGASAPGTRLFAEYGFTGEHVADVVRRALERARD